MNIHLQWYALVCLSDTGSPDDFVTLNNEIKTQFVTLNITDIINIIIFQIYLRSTI